jgi:hypothetical protein
MKFCDPKFSRVATIVALLVAIGSGCTFVEMAPGGEDVRVVGPGQLSAGCIKRGKVEVSVKDRLGPYSRDELRVKDELEVLARNEAPGLDADTIQPEGPPADGVQRFTAYRCGTATSVTAPPPPADSAQTAPLKDE